MGEETLPGGQGNIFNLLTLKHITPDVLTVHILFLYGAFFSTKYKFCVYY